MKPGHKALIILSPITLSYFSLVSAIAIVETKPKNQNLCYPYPELMMKQEYKDAYVKKAWQMKRRQTWKDMLIGTGIVAGITAIAITAVLISINSH